MTKLTTILIICNRDATDVLEMQFDWSQDHFLITVSSSFSVFDGGVLLADAAAEEEDLCLEGTL